METGKTAQTVLPRVEALRQAASIIAGDRDAQYGGPEENFERIAKVWSVITKYNFTREDVAMMMVGLKLARYGSKSGFQSDTWIDIAGYAGCGYEVGQLESQNNAETASPIQP
jgi:hypothetical protein